MYIDISEKRLIQLAQQVEDVLAQSDSRSSDLRIWSEGHVLHFDLRFGSLLTSYTMNVGRILRLEMPTEIAEKYWSMRDQIATYLMLDSGEFPLTDSAASDLRIEFGVPWAGKILFWLSQMISPVSADLSAARLSLLVNQGRPRDYEKMLWLFQRSHITDAWFEELVAEDVEQDLSRLCYRLASSSITLSVSAFRETLRLGVAGPGGVSTEFRLLTANATASKQNE